VGEAPRELVVESLEGCFEGLPLGGGDPQACQLDQIDDGWIGARVAWLHGFSSAAVWW
jgi:hypothetical protein